MIAWGDIYKVVEAMAPLYFALGLGYGSVRWWRFFTAEQCGAINTMVVCFSMPFFTFDFVVRADPFAMNYGVIAADAVAKLLTVLAAAACARCAKAKAGAYSWSMSITGFSLSAFNSTLVVGVPLLDAMYGKWAQDLIVQIGVVQSIVWNPLLLLALELRKARVVGDVSSLALSTTMADDDDGSASTTSDDDRVKRVSPDKDGDVEEAAPPNRGRRILLWPTARTVGLKLARNPNVYASVLGVAWACIAYRWRVGMPGIVTGSLQVMSRAGTGMSMFSMGLFTAQQERIVACGAGLTVLGMVLRFVAGPLTALAGAAALGLRGDVLRFAIIQRRLTHGGHDVSGVRGVLQVEGPTRLSSAASIWIGSEAALPQSISTFVFAKEYGLHADVLSTAVIFGTLVSLPVLIAYYAVLDAV